MFHSSGNAIEVPIPSLEAEVLEMVPKSECLELSVATLPHIAAALDHTISSDDVDIVAIDTSPKHTYSDDSERKFKVFEDAPDSLLQTGMCSINILTEGMILIRGSTLHTHNVTLMFITGELQNTDLKMLS
jgi:hypothetical protein